jgi:hypothetical protein
MQQLKTDGRNIFNNFSTKVNNIHHNSQDALKTDDGIEVEAPTLTN